MSFKLFGTDIKISYLFITFVTLMIFTDRTGLIIPFILAATVHETAHLMAMKKMNVAPKEITMSPGSVLIIKPECFDRKKDNLILLCGPLSNLILFLFFYLLYSLYDNIFILKNAVVELVVCIFNLLPAKGLDGGAILYNCLCAYFSHFWANIINIIVSSCTGIVFLIFGITAIIKGNINLSYIILGVYILFFTFVKN